MKLVKAVSDPSRTIAKSTISEVLSGAVGVGIGRAIGFATLYFGGSVAGLSAFRIINRLVSVCAICLSLIK